MSTSSANSQILNDDMIRLIALYTTDVYAFLYWSLTCKRFATLCNSDNVWMEYYEKNGLKYTSLGRKSVVGRVYRFNQVKTEIIERITKQIMVRAGIVLLCCEDSCAFRENIPEHVTTELGKIFIYPRSLKSPDMSCCGRGKPVLIERNHPHIWTVTYSTKDNDGDVTRKNIVATDEEIYNLIYPMILSRDIPVDILGDAIIDSDTIELAFKEPYIPMS